MVIPIGTHNKDNILSVSGYGLTANNGSYFEIPTSEAAELVKKIEWQAHMEDVWNELKKKNIDISEHSKKLGDTAYPTYKMEDITSRYEKYLQKVTSECVKSLCLTLAISDFLKENK
ncbi:MAG: hypothetical protein J5956_11535 [Ruminococcus sp.]|nr:hypothetical protein [Ruminococcus sp.]